LRQFTFIIITSSAVRAHKPWELEYGRTAVDIGGQKPATLANGSDDGGLEWEWGWGDSQNGRRLHALCLVLEINKIIKW